MVIKIQHIQHIQHIKHIQHILYCNIHSSTQNLLRGPTDAFGYMNVILLHSDQRHVSATHVGD
jgi:hypothetical protein